MPRRRDSTSMVEVFDDIRGDYEAAKTSRLRRTRTGLGGTADAQLGTDVNLWTIREYARDMDRNDGVVGQAVTRAVDNVLRTGLTLDPRTGDKALDADLKARWDDWGGDRTQCDSRQMRTWAELERLALRARHVDGDIFGLPLDNGRLQVIEAERCTTPTNTKRRVVHGVYLDADDAPREYWFGKHADRTQRVQRVADIERYKAFEDGHPNVFHVFDTKRVSQTRGITAFSPMFKVISMFDDLNIAKLVQAQVVSCIAAFIQAEKGNLPFGERSTDTQADGTSRSLEKLYPGMIHRMAKDEQIQPFSPNVPNAEYFDHVRLILRLIGANLGLPLSITLLDTTQTTFHGYRGELEQARIGFRWIQTQFPLQWNAPTYRWQVRRWLPKLGMAARKLERDGLVYRHRWMGQGFPYVDPQKDRVADKIALDNVLDSPRRVVGHRGGDWDDIVRETVDDNGELIRRAIEKAAALTAETGEQITWREVLNPRAKAPAKAPRVEGAKGAASTEDAA